jgi:phage terminase large subunit
LYRVRWMQAPTKLRIPYHYEPRPYQLPLFQAMDSGYTRAVCIWHRRAGKDKSLFNLLVKKAVERVGVYYYFFPTYNQGRKILWEGIDKDGFKFLDHIPKQLIKSADKQQMMIELTTGSVIRVIGTDNIDTVVGTNPVGCVFSEYSLQDPRAWDFVRPILAENGGWAIFNYTPRGKNHGYSLYEMARRSEKWFTNKLTVDDTHAIDQDVLDNERSEMYQRTGNDALFLQEYYVSFDAPVEGAYYGHQMLQAEEDQRITGVPYDISTEVMTAWDLGIGDSTAIWFYQVVGREVHIIDYYENSGEGLPHYISVLKQKGYIYGRHYAPHDIQVRELSSGKTRREVARGLGITFDIAPNVAIEDGIEAARTLLPRCWFDSTKTSRGLDALRSYHKEFDDKLGTWKNQALHDWASHGADAFRYLALSFREPRVKTPPRKRRFDPVTGRPMD